MKRAFFLLLFIIVYNQSGAQEAVIFKKNSELNLNPYFHYYLDSSGSMGVAEIRNMSHKFAPVGEEDLRLEVDETIVWLRLRIHNPYNRKEDAVLDFKDPTLLYMTLYQINQDPLLSGTGTEQNKKNIRGNRNAFILSLSAGETRDVLIRVDSKNFMTLKATIEDDEYFFQKTGDEKTFIGFYYGILFLILIYTFILFVISRLNYFFWYALYLFVNILFTGMSDGLLPQYLYFLVGWFDGYHELIIAILSNLVGMLFLRSYFKTREWASKLDKTILGVIIGIAVLGTVLFIIDPESGFALMRLIGLITLGFYLGVSAYAISRDRSGSYIFFIAFSFLGLFILIFIFNLFRLIPYGHFVQYSIHYGFLVSNLILSGAMGARIYHLYQSYLQEEMDKQMIIRQKNEELEIQVQERTLDLATKESLLRSILDNSTRGIWLIDQNFMLQEFNLAFKYAWKAAFGVEIERGIQLQDTYVDEDYKKVWRKRYKRIFDGEIINITDEYVVAGEKRTFEVFGVPIKNQDKIEFAALFSTDITDRIMYEEQLKQQNENLLKVNEELDRFVYSASHDLKAPLSSLQGLITLLKLETDETSRETYYEMMEKSIKRLDQFIRDIIDYSRNTRVELKNARIDIGELIDSVFEDLHYMEHATDFKLKKSIDQQAPFYGDETRMRIIFRNLLSNALHYGYKEKGKKQVDISGTVNQQFMEMAIRDHGPGISEEHRENVFKMFYRANESSDGTGLGLYIVKETLEKMGGQITMETSSEGTRFLIKVPNPTPEN